MILSNSPGLGSRGIFKDWAMQTPPNTGEEKEEKRGKQCIQGFTLMSEEPKSRKCKDSKQEQDSEFLSPWAIIFWLLEQLSSFTNEPNQSQY